MRTIGLLLVCLLLAACADTDELTYSETRLAPIPTHTRILRLSPQGARDVELQGTEAVLFLVNDSPDRQLGLVVHGRTNMQDCPRTAGFASDEKRKVTYSESTLPPGGVATLCFHQPGRFRYELWFDGVRAGEGTIAVAGKAGGEE